MIHLAPHSQVLEAPRPHKHNTNAGWTGGSESVEPILSYFVSPGKDEMADDERIYREDEVSLCCITHDVHIMRRQKVLVVGWRARGEGLNVARDAVVAVGSGRTGLRSALACAPFVVGNASACTILRKVMGMPIHTSTDRLGPPSTTPAAPRPHGTAALFPANHRPRTKREREDDGNITPKIHNDRSSFDKMSSN